MTPDFKTIAMWVRDEIEQGLVDNPSDPGGLTKYGISQRAFPSVDVRSLTPDDALAIYRKHMWDRVLGDELPPRMRLLVFDAAIHSGVYEPTRWLQTLAGQPADGIMGSGTIRAIGRANMDELAPKYMARRAKFLASLRTWNKFQDGWMKRLFKVAEFNGRLNS